MFTLSNSDELARIQAGELTGPAAAEVLRAAHAELRVASEQFLDATKQVSKAEEFLLYGEQGRGKRGFSYA